MARFLAEDADNYGGSSGGNYFKLKSDGDVAKVRLLGRDINDFPGYSVHEIEVNGNRRYVNCLREYQDPREACPLCADGDKKEKKVYAKLYIPLFNIEEDEVQVWERGKTMFKKLSSYCARHKNVFQYVTEIERNGKANDQRTDYQFYDDGNGPDKDIDLDDFDVPDILGRYVFDKDFDELEYYLETGEFPEEDDEEEEDEKPSRKSAKKSNKRSRDEDDEDDGDEDDEEEEEKPKRGRGRGTNRRSRGASRKKKRDDDDEEDY